jgi:hypothetical protein
MACCHYIQLQTPFKRKETSNRAATYSNCILFLTCSLPNAVKFKSSFCGKIAGPAEKNPVWGQSNECDNAG